MIIRPVDENGDILPVLVSASLLKGAGAVTRLVKDRLELLAGDWWENPAWGNPVIDMLKESRLTEADTQALANSILRRISGRQMGYWRWRTWCFQWKGRHFPIPVW